VIVVVPDDTPVITPVPDPAVATAVLLLLHVPPPEVLANVVVAVGQTVKVPVIEATAVLIVTVVVAIQLPPSE
jgi:hypothetical protein